MCPGNLGPIQFSSNNATVNILACIFLCSFVSHSEERASVIALCVLNLDNQTAIQRGDMRTVGFLLSSEMPMETEELSEFRPELALWP